MFRPTRLLQRAARREITLTPPLRRLRRVVGFFLVVFLGTVLGVTLSGSGTTSIGPLRTELTLQPSFSGGTVIELGPLGEIRFDSHAGLIRVNLEVRSMSPEAATELVSSNEELDRLSRSASADLRAGFRSVALRAGLAGAAGAFVLALLVYRRSRPALYALAASVTLSAFAAGSAYASYEPQAIAEPEYRGLMTAAPSLIGSAKDIAENFDAYRDQMGRLLTNVSRLYATGSELRSFQAGQDTIAVLHVSDLHLNPQGWDMIRQLVDEFGIDVIVDSGDISDHGTPVEDRYLEAIPGLGRPYLYVRGNHDSEHTASVIDAYPNATVLDNGARRSIAGLTFAGTGDPRLTPDKRVTVNDRAVLETGRTFAEQLAGTDGVDVAIVHDPDAGKLLDGTVPLVLSGHWHRRVLDPLPGGTTIRVEASTGGSGLRAIGARGAAPLAASVLYFDRVTRRLVALDEVTMSGLGLASVQINRRLVQQP